MEGGISPERSPIRGTTGARSRFAVCCAALLAVAIVALSGGAAGAKPGLEASFGFSEKKPPPEEGTQVAGLRAPAQVVRDRVGVPHVYAENEHDAYLLVGYLHAEDRLFQMDQSRRQASGTMAELLGTGALASDVQLRTLGLRRAAARSLQALSEESRAVLEAYAVGVNAWLDTHPLPSEYTALELTQIPEWTALDSMAISKLLAFGLSFDLDDLDRTQKLLAYIQAGVSRGFDGMKLFREDVMRSEPFAHAPSILPGETSQPLRSGGPPPWSSSFLEESAGDAAAEALQNAEEAGIPTGPTDQGSNIWVVSGAKSESGRPMVASDPHLSLASPPTFYETGITVSDDVSADEAMNLYGVTFPGTPALVHGTNGHVSWGSTVNPTDVTDVYQEQLTIQGGIPVATTYQGNQEPTQIIPETYRANQPGNGTQDDTVVVPPSASVPPATIVVPRRNNGPLVSVSGNTGISVQYTGFSRTREPDFFRLLSRADTVGEAIDAQRYFDFGAQNWMYVDDRGNVGYKTSAEIPIREDLQAGTVAGLPPFFIRNGTGGNEWIADPTQAEDQALAYEILPFDEMDGLVNPERGWISNANQDPTGQTFDNDPLNELRPGGGIRYITPGHEDGNRNARISDRIVAALGGGSVSFAEMQSIQADVKLHDATVLVPHITSALEAAQAAGAPPALAALGADPKVREAVARLAAWDFSTPTGIPQGYDESDSPGALGDPTQAEKDASVAATIFSLWRGRALALIVDAPLAARGLGATSLLPTGDQAMTALRRFIANPGPSASGIPFLPNATARDTAVLQALRNALNLAASGEFAPAFAGSTNLTDYLWGRLHRKVFGHTLGGPFSIPPGAGFSHLAPGLNGVATDGGFSVVDASSHNPRASSLNGFMFGGGPARRFVSEARTLRPNAVQVIPGGESGNPSGPWFGNQLGLWLTDDYHGVSTVRGEVLSDAAQQQLFVPAS
jgi:penicillin G amidase